MGFNKVLEGGGHMSSFLKVIEKLFNFTINNEKLKIVKNLRYLGVQIDNKLTFDIQANKICQQLNDKNYLFRKTRAFMNDETATTVMKVMVLPFLDYVNIIMMGNFEYILKRIQVLMNNSMRIAENTKKHTSIEFLLDKFNVLNFKDRMILNVLKILKRKVDRVRTLFKKENYEWIEYSDGNITIIRSLSFPQNIKEEPPDKLIEKNYKTHDGLITIRKLLIIHLSDI